MKRPPDPARFDEANDSGYQRFERLVCANRFSARKTVLQRAHQGGWIVA